MRSVHRRLLYLLGSAVLLVAISQAAAPFSVTLLEPRTQFGLTDLAGADTSIRLSVTRDGQPVQDLSASLLYNGTRINTTTTREGSAYRIYFTAPPALETVDLELVDASGYAQRFDLLHLPTRPWPLYLSLLLLALLGGGLIAYRFRDRFTQYLEQIRADSKAERLDALKAAKADVKKQYYNRQIDEDAFREQMQEYKREIAALEHELGDA